MDFEIKLCAGVESGSDRVLKAINKGTTYNICMRGTLQKTLVEEYIGDIPVGQVVQEDTPSGEGEIEGDITSYIWFLIIIIILLIIIIMKPKRGINGQ